jgi:hypothetical protein
MRRRTVWYKVTDVSEQPDAAIFEVEEVDLANWLNFVSFFVVLLLGVMPVKPDASNPRWYLSLTN